MALILDPSNWSSDRLLEMVRSNRDAIAGLLKSLDEWPYGVKDPGSFMTAHDLLSDALAFSELVVPNAPSSAEFLARLANLQYDVMLAAIDLMKSHSEMTSRVPGARK